MRILIVSLVLCGAFQGASANDLVLDGKMRHLRVGGQREWSDFPEQPASASLNVKFSGKPNAGEWTLRLRQQDVRQTWKVLLNGKELYRLPPDENDMVVCVPIPAGSILAGNNTLDISQVGKIADDVRIGEIMLHERPMREVLSEGTVEIAVSDGDQAGPNPQTLPCRLTIINAQGALMSVGHDANNHLAVRPGVVYTATGRASFGLPAGEYTIFAGRGFAYGIDSVRLSVKKGDVLKKSLALRREVPADGHVSCDTHVHTLTFSGHGDCSLEERMVTLAGENIELPIATDHNRQIDFSDAAVKLGVRRYFTPVIGNEVTTALGHFNVFPAPADSDKSVRVPDYKARDWTTIFASIEERTRARVVILNHPRDLHSGYRPFGPRHFNRASGANIDGWVLRANAMEVVNSGAHQSDVMRPFHDWLALLNRGVFLTPVGASDSHDVARYIVGQARTYVRSRSADPGKIDVAEAVDNFAHGRVLVSCGLLTDISVNGKYSPGDLVPAAGGAVQVKVRVLGPSWVKADRVELYANGRKVHEAKIGPGQKTPVKWEGEWTISGLRHDTHLVAVAAGPGVEELYWPISKPYQATTPKVLRRVFACSGAVWLDVDGDGKRTCAFEYAQRLMKKCDPAKPASVAELVRALADHDEAVAVQAASLLQTAGISVRDRGVAEAAAKAGPHVQRGFEAFFEAWRECEIARGEK